MNLSAALKNMKTFLADQSYGPVLFWLGYVAFHAEATENVNAIHAIAELAKKLMTSLQQNDRDYERLTILTLESAVLAAFGKR